MRLLAILMICVGLAGCGAVAFPFRVTGDAVRIVPIVGDPVAAPFDAVGDAIDPPRYYPNYSQPYAYYPPPGYYYPPPY